MSALNVMWGVHSFLLLQMHFILEQSFLADEFYSLLAYKLNLFIAQFGKHG